MFGKVLSKGKKIEFVFVEKVFHFFFVHNFDDDERERQAENNANIVNISLPGECLITR